MRRDVGAFIAAAAVLALLCGLRLSFAADAPILVPQTPLLTPRAPGSFDYLAVDEKYRRLLIAHSGSRTFDVVDLNNSSVLRQEAVGIAHGIAVDIKAGKYFVGTSTPQSVVVMGRKFIVKDEQIAAGGPIDAIALDSKNDMLYADRVDNSQILAISGKTNKLYTSIQLSGALEYIVYDPVSDRIYQNNETTGNVLVINPNTNRLEATWSAAPATGLHGLAVDGTTHRLFTAGDNGKLAVLNTSTGAVVGAVDIPTSVDQIAFDPGLRRLYCPSSIGVMAIIQETDAGAQHLADVTVPRRTHSVAVDTVTHAVWIAYGAADEDYVLKFVQGAPGATPTASASASP